MKVINRAYRTNQRLLMVWLILQFVQISCFINPTGNAKPFKLTGSAAKLQDSFWIPNAVCVIVLIFDG